jgi:hypothetical protein
VILTLNPVIAPGATATVTYAGSAIRDASGNNTLGFSSTFTNIDNTPPTVIGSAYTNSGSTLTINFSEPLLTTSLPTPANFTGVTISSIAVSGNAVTLTLSTPVANGASPNVVYSGTTIKDLASNNAVGFTVNPVAPFPVLGLVMANRSVGFNEVSPGAYIHQGTNNTALGAITATKVFSGDKTFEMTAVTLTGNIDMGLREATGAGIEPIQTHNIGLRVNFGASIAVANQGIISLISSPFGAPQATDLYRITRTGSTFKLWIKRGVGAWTDVYTYTHTFASDMSPLVLLFKTNDQVSLTLY